MNGDSVQVPVEEEVPLVNNSSNRAADEFYWNKIAREIHEKAEDFDEQRKNVQLLYDEVPYIPSSVFEKRDRGEMWMLHRVLLTILNLKYFRDDQRSDKETEEYKKKFDTVHEQLLDIAKLLLIKTDIDYRRYSYKFEENIVSTLVNQIDQKNEDEGERAVTFFLRQILHGENNKFINMCDTSTLATEQYLKLFRNFKDLLEVTFAVGSLRTLTLLVELGKKFHDFNLMETPLFLVATRSRIYVKQENLAKYYECFDFILSLKDLNVNAIQRKDANTALHIATDPVLIQKLLKLQPSLNIKNHAEQLPIQNPCFTYEMFVKHLDSFVSNVPQRRLLGDKNFKYSSMIFLDLKAISSEYFIITCRERQESLPENPRELQLLNFIAAVKSDKKLTNAITHPCLATVIEVYWNVAKYWMVVKKIPMIIMSMLILSLFFFKFSEDYCVTVIILCLVQFVLKVFAFLPKMLTRTPFKRLMLLEVAFLLLPIVWLNYSNDFFLALAFLFASFALTIYLAICCRTVAHTLMMFIRVISSTARYSFTMTSILIGFSLSLKMTIDNFDEFKFKNATRNESDTDSSEDIQTNLYSSFFSSVLKSIFMSIGELNVTDLKFNNGMSCLLIFAFVFFISISFMNLLNGLAFNDVQQVKGKAEYLYRIFQIRIMLIVKEET